MFERAIKDQIEANLNRQKVTVLLGARRVGKTALLRRIYETRRSTSLWLNGEDATVWELLEQRSESAYRRLLSGKTLLFIDEAQYVPDIGRKVKLMIDTIEPLHIVITGSSAFNVEKSGEPLVGRTIQYSLYPVAQTELGENPLEAAQNLEERLVYGSYPELLGRPTLAEKKDYLFDLVSTYLLKDVFAFEDVRNPKKIRDLLNLIAYQIGGEVSLEELGRQLGMSKNTVERYLDLLSKVYIIYNRRGYSSNLRKEIVKNSRWYFFDNGVRNALIGNFNPPALRTDVGQLWENYVLAERLKKNAYSRRYVNSYFWRTYDGQEIDLIEEEAAAIAAFECKWTEGNARTPVAFRNAYPGASFSVVNRRTYLDLIT